MGAATECANTYFRFPARAEVLSERTSSTIQPLWQKQGRSIERVGFDRVQRILLGLSCEVPSRPGGYLPQIKIFLQSQSRI